MPPKNICIGGEKLSVISSPSDNHCLGFHVCFSRFLSLPLHMLNSYRSFLLVLKKNGIVPYKLCAIHSRKFSNFNIFFECCTSTWYKIQKTSKQILKNLSLHIYPQPPSSSLQKQPRVSIYSLPADKARNL